MASLPPIPKICLLPQLKEKTKGVHPKQNDIGLMFLDNRYNDNKPLLSQTAISYIQHVCNKLSNHIEGHDMSFGLFLRPDLVLDGLEAFMYSFHNGTVKHTAIPHDQDHFLIPLREFTHACAHVCKLLAHTLHLSLHHERPSYTLKVMKTSPNDGTLVFNYMGSITLIIVSAGTKTIKMFIEDMWCDIELDSEQFLVVKV